ncbi:hypothetical protein [Zunongwangia atlantica]|nr:hypothetical protein [Zunongwangia atlantica]
MGTKKLDNKATRLYQVSERTGIPKENIIEILSEAGFLIIGDKSNFVLKRKHLEVIEHYFSLAIKNYFNEAKKNYKNYDNKKLEGVRRFLSNFLDEFPFLIESLPADSFFKTSLNLDRVKDYFYRLIFSIHNSSNSNLYKELKRLKYRVRPKSLKSYNDLRKKSAIFFISGHYYTFNTEEDSNYALQLNRFQVFKMSASEALNKFLIDLKHIFWNQKIYLLQE